MPAQQTYYSIYSFVLYLPSSSGCFVLHIVYDMSCVRLIPPRVGPIPTLAYLGPHWLAESLVGQCAL